MVVYMLEYITGHRPTHAPLLLATETPQSILRETDNLRFCCTSLDEYDVAVLCLG